MSKSACIPMTRPTGGSSRSGSSERFRKVGGKALIDHRLRFLTFPMRTIVLGTHSTPMARPETSQVPMRSLCT